MRTAGSDSDLKRLFTYNRCVLSTAAYAQLSQIEQQWIVRRVNTAEANAPVLSSRAELAGALKELLAREEENPPESARYLAQEATFDQFKIIVGEFAVDGLTEAQSFFPIIARLPHRSQMAVFRVLVDEFGCGNVEQSHSQLYRSLLTELGMPIDVEHYLDETSDEIYAFVNLFYWLAARAPKPEYFLGALAYLEASILYFFRYYAQACDRLGIKNGRYYTEHLHIDNFHSKEMQIAIRELDAAWGLDCTKAWVGIELTSTIIGEAFDAAVAKARKVA